MLRLRAASRGRRAWSLAPPLSLLAFLLIASAGTASCSLGTGTGRVDGTLAVRDCWSGNFSLRPDFFAAVPYLNTLELRIQRGGDYETFSDGVEILIDDLAAIRGTSGGASEYGQPLTVSLPAGVTPPGVPLPANPNPPIVHLSLYLQATCQIQDVALYALDAVSLDADGTCNPLPDGGVPVISCPGSTGGLANPDAGAADAGAGDAGTPGDGGTAAPPSVGRSTITFTALSNGDPTEVNAAARLNAGTFDVYLADPREICPGGIGPPPPCRGHLQGQFNFYFERGRPAQPFP